MTVDTGSEQRVTVGFIGTGIMGFHMARRLAQAGHTVQVWNRTPDKAERLAPFGVQVCVCAADAACNADVVICMLSAGPVCDEVLLGRGEVLASMRRGSALIVMSSIPVETARQQQEAAAARNVAFTLLMAASTLSCGQQGPLVLPESARPIERLENPPAAEPETQDDERRDEL